MSVCMRQGDEPLGSIYLRGCVVTAVEFVPDGEWQLQISFDVSFGIQSPAENQDDTSRSFPTEFERFACVCMGSRFQPKGTTLMETSLRSSHPMRFTTSSRLQQRRRERSGSKQSRKCQNEWLERQQSASDQPYV